MENDPKVVGGTIGRLDSIGKLFSDTWILYKARFSTLSKIILIPAVMVALGSILTAYHGPAILTILGGLLSLGGIVVFIFAGIALLFAVIDGTDFSESYRRSPSLFWPLVWVGILSGVIILGGFMMLFIPGIMMGIWFLFSRYIVIAENRRGLNALVQSREYARGYWWALLGRMLLMGIAIAVTAGVVAALLTLALTIAFGAFVVPLISMLIWIFVVPFSVVYPYVIYKNMAVLKPELATTQSNASRGFLKASGIVGMVGIVLIPIAIISFIGLALVMSSRVHLDNFPGTLNLSSSTASGTFQN